MTQRHKDTDYHKTLLITMGEARKLVNKLVELRFIADRDEHMRTHTNPLKVMVSGVVVNFKGHSPEDYARVACEEVAREMFMRGEDKTKTAIKTILGIDA